MKKIIITLSLILICLCFALPAHSVNIIYENGSWTIWKFTDEMTDKISYALASDISNEEFAFQYSNGWKYGEGWLITSDINLEDSGRITLRIDKNPPITPDAITSAAISAHSIYFENEIFDDRYHIILSDEMKKGNILLIQIRLNLSYKSIIRIPLNGFTECWNFWKNEIEK